MDTSEQYIKMCDCPEIQDGWKDFMCDGDFEILKDRGEWPIQTYCSDCYDNVLAEDHRMEFVWLPRQDQLQDMLPKRATWFENLYRFYEWVSVMHGNQHDFSAPCTMFNSHEQLWLAFVMHTIHNKSWNGSEWITANTA